MTTNYHAKYYAHELTKISNKKGIDRISMSLFDSSVDLNPHQVEAAIFAFRSPLSKGVILADEVGLGKTIEAGLVLAQYWAERKRKLLVICPASLRKQWREEIQEKFNIPATILDAKSYNESINKGNSNPFNQRRILITSYHFIKNKKNEVSLIPWDLVIIDEAHKLRNVHQPSNKMGNAIKEALEGRKKILLTATPLQNSLLELYGLSLLIDEHIFGDKTAFRQQFMNQDADLDSLRKRLSGFVHRTLRNQVKEYIPYTKRRTITYTFNPNDEEQKLYEDISEFLQRNDTYSIPNKQRTLTTLIIRKLLASSTKAVTQTLETMKKRLEKKLGQLGSKNDEQELYEQFITENEMEYEWLEENTLSNMNFIENENKELDKDQIKREIKELENFISRAESITLDSKTKVLLDAIKTGFEEMENVGANKKVLIFTESRRTQEYLYEFLIKNGYKNKVVLFNGVNNDIQSKNIYKNWVLKNSDNGRVSGSKSADMRSAIVDYFKNDAEIMIATESAAEGINLQFCSLIINYDLPWNPQRIEQRIGRCHRYGQKHDVVVINFLNSRNETDRKVYELLDQKFNLFNGLFGASDEVLGSIESGIDFEKRILNIYQQCRTKEQIEKSFEELQQELEEKIQHKLKETREKLFKNFDVDVHDKLRSQQLDTEIYLDRIGRMFWDLTKTILKDRAKFDDSRYKFKIEKSPNDKIPNGTYHLISKNKKHISGRYLYRISHPLGQYVIDSGKNLKTPTAEIAFNITNYPLKLSVIERLKGKSGYLILSKLTIKSFETEERLTFNAVTESGELLDQETCEKLFMVNGSFLGEVTIPENICERLRADNKKHKEVVIHQVLQKNNEFFKEEQMRLEKWADDCIMALEKELKSIKAQIRSVISQIHNATSIEEQEKLKKKKKMLERQQRRKRNEIFDMEDEIFEKRDHILSELKKRMIQDTHFEELFIIKWNVV